MIALYSQIILSTGLLIVLGEREFSLRRLFSILEILNHVQVRLSLSKGQIPLSTETRKSSAAPVVRDALKPNFSNRTKTLLG